MFEGERVPSHPRERGGSVNTAVAAAGAALIICSPARAWPKVLVSGIKWLNAQWALHQLLQDSRNMRHMAGEPTELTHSSSSAGRSHSGCMVLQAMQQAALQGMQLQLQAAAGLTQLLRAVRAGGAARTVV